MNKDELKALIAEYQDFVSKINLMERVQDFEDFNYVIVGARRTGKTYTLYQHIQHLISQGHSIEEMLFVNFEDERILNIQASELNYLLEAYKEMYSYNPILFLDEIQNVNGWEKFARRVADQNYKVFITGSNAKMLSSEIATTLGGRFIIKEINSFSFGEYLKFHKIELKDNWYYKPIKNKVVNLFGDYFYFGSIPSVFSLDDKRSFLSGLFDKILLNDIVLRYKIRNDEALRLLVKKLAESVMQPTTNSRLANIIKSTGIAVSRNTIVDFIKYLKESYMIFDISNFSDNLPERENNKKRYFLDNGILNLFLYQPETILLENLVAANLRRKYGGNAIFYYKKNIEVDFYIPTQKTAVQVSYNVSNYTTLEREVNALMKLSSVFDIEKMLIITNNEEKTITSDNGKNIKVIPIWKWLIEIEKGVL